jgi:hypothetical protein
VLRAAARLRGAMTSVRCQLRGELGARRRRRLARSDVWMCAPVRGLKAADTTLWDLWLTQHCGACGVCQGARLLPRFLNLQNAAVLTRFDQDCQTRESFVEMQSVGCVLTHATRAHTLID